VAKFHATRHGLSVVSGRVPKSQAVAYITHRAENEMVVRPEHVVRNSFATRAVHGLTTD
jgi:hypothetical protein